MYTHLFGLRCLPFEASVHADQTFESNAVKEATGRIRHLVERRGIGMVTGEAGCGKTTACRIVTNKLHVGHFKVLYVSLSTGSVLDTLNTISAELGLPSFHRRAGAWKAIREQITRLGVESRKHPILIFDEAHLLRSEVIENLRLLSNFNMDSEYHLSMILVGLTELDRRLKMTAHESFAQRLIVRHQMDNLMMEEIEPYINHRLKVAGAPANHSLFDSQAMESIRLGSKGIPRLVNNLAHYSLTAAALDKARQVTCEHVGSASRELPV